jgi:signal transduction histidine kinase
MSRLPIRVRLTLAFATALALMLAVAWLFVYAWVRADLDESVDDALDARAAAVARSGAAAGLAGDAEDGFALVLDDGRVVDRAGGVRGIVEPFSGERRVAGIDGTVRVLARDGVVVGQSLEDRDEVLSGLVAAFALGGPLAVALASLLGYVLAGSALRPVEAMRRRAAAGDERLPLPAAHDEIHRLGATLNELLARLRDSLERERRFVADASHELRTPLAVLKTELEAGLRGPDKDAAISNAIEACDRLAQLAEDLLVIARTADGELPVRREPVPARPLLEGVRDRFADRAERAGRAIRVEDGELTLNADPLRLRQALGNLVDNALRHGDGDVVLRARGEDGGVSLEVADGGRGFGPDIADRAFDRFARGDLARTRGGTGLGLAIVRAIAEAHGGHATLEGATVRVWMPSQGHLSGVAHDPEP